MTRAARAGARARDESGAFMILFALLLVSLLTISAIVVDLGGLRASDRDDALVADVAALAAGPQLSDSARRIPGRTVVGACQDAFEVVRLNIEELGPSAALNCGPLATYITCTAMPTPMATTVTATGTGTFDISVTYPVPDSLITDARAPRSSSTDGQPCERMKVTVGKTKGSVFAGILGVNSLTSSASAVVRGRTGASTVYIPALLLLERFDCQALQTSGSGNVLVKATDADHPGTIHADSAGLTSSPGSCGGTGNGNNVVYGTPIPNGSGSTRPGEPSIVAEGSLEPACPNTPGRKQGLLTLAFPDSGHAVADVPAGVCPSESAGDIASRRLVDIRYNSSLTGSGINALRTHSEGRFALIGQPLNAIRSLGYQVFPDDFAGTACTTNSNQTINATMVYVNCDDLAPSANASYTFTATKVLTKGKITVGAGQSVRFPNATELLVNGCGSSTCANGVQVSGTFTVNLGGQASCASRPGSTVAPATVVIRSGPLRAGSNGTVRMCHTFVYLSGLASPYQSDTGSPAGCHAETPCPRTSTYTGYVDLAGSVIDWEAPNQTLSAPDVNHPYEDLALWSEAGNASTSQGSPNSSVGGNGTSNIAGLIFLPNALFIFQGNTTISQQFNAQFVARRVILKGQGDLVMKPGRQDAVPLPVSAYNLIR